MHLVVQPPSDPHCGALRLEPRCCSGGKTRRRLSAEEAPEILQERIQWGRE